MPSAVAVLIEYLRIDTVIESFASTRSARGLEHGDGFSHLDLSIRTVATTSGMPVVNVCTATKFPGDAGGAARGRDASEDKSWLRRRSLITLVLRREISFR